MVGGYEAAHEAHDELERVYDSLARFLNASSRDEIALFESATVAWNAAFLAISRTFQPGDRVLTVSADYASNHIAMLQAKERYGINIEVIPDGPDGKTDVGALAAMIKGATGGGNVVSTAAGGGSKGKDGGGGGGGQVKLIAVTHVPTNGGLVNPAEAIGAVAREHGIPYLLDACQSAGQLPLDVQALGCDFLSATGRKFLRGPRGTGFLFVRKECLAPSPPAAAAAAATITTTTTTTTTTSSSSSAAAASSSLPLLPSPLVPPALDLFGAEWTDRQHFVPRADARRFETWECSPASRLGLGAAVDYALDLGMDTIWDRVRTLAAHLRGRLARDVPGLRITDLGVSVDDDEDGDDRRCGIVTFVHERVSPCDMVAALKGRGFLIATSSVSSTRLDMERRGLDKVVRAGVHYYNSEEELDGLVAAVAEVVASAAAAAAAAASGPKAT